MFASMLPTIIETTASVRTLERSRPLLDSSSTVSCGVTLPAVLPLFTIAAHDVFLDLAAVAAGRNANFTSSTRAIVAWARTTVLSAGQHLATRLTAAPTVLVVRIYAASSNGLAATEAVLNRSQQGARRTRTGVTGHATRMRTFLW